MKFRVSEDEPENSFWDGTLIQALNAWEAAEQYVYDHHHDMDFADEVEVWVWIEGDAESVTCFNVHVEETIVCRAVEKKEDQL